MHGVTPRRRTAGLLSLAFALSLLAAACGGGGSEPSPTPGSTATASITASAPKTSAPAPAAKTWHKVIAATGNADKRTPTFTLTDGQARLKYTARDTSGIGAIVVAIYIVEKGHSIDEEGGFAEVTLSEPGSSSTELANPPGDYYLEVKAANARWTVTIEQLR